MYIQLIGIFQCYWMSIPGSDIKAPWRYPRGHIPAPWESQSENGEVLPGKQRNIPTVTGGKPIGKPSRKVIFHNYVTGW